MEEEDLKNLIDYFESSELMVSILLITGEVCLVQIQNLFPHLQLLILGFRWGFLTPGYN